MNTKIAQSNDEIQHEIDVDDIAMWGLQTDPPEFIIFGASEVKFNDPAQPES